MNVRITTVGELRQVVREALGLGEGRTLGRRTCQRSRDDPGDLGGLDQLLPSEEGDIENAPTGELRSRKIAEVDTDPSNNPGRPADAAEYLGMHPKPTAAMSPPYASGGSEPDPSEPPNEPEEGT